MVSGGGDDSHIKTATNHSLHGSTNSTFSIQIMHALKLSIWGWAHITPSVSQYKMPWYGLCNLARLPTLALQVFAGVRQTTTGDKILL